MKTAAPGVRALSAAAIVALGLLLAAGASAQAYPSQPIKLLVGFSPGGGLDISCRHRCAP